MSSAVSDNQNIKSDKPLEHSLESQSKLHEESDIPTPVSTTDTKEQSIPISDKHHHQPVQDQDSTSISSPIKRKEESSSETPKPKKSRKLQGAGVKKPLYSRYESLYIVKAYKTISDKHPNLVLIDLFKIVALLFNEEAQRQGFKERTPDQLYQKYKRIQHGLNHGETEFLEFFKKNNYNPREWIPDFSNSENDEILKYIKFPRLDESINEIVGSSVANLKPPLPDLYDDEDDDELDDENKQTITDPTTRNISSTTAGTSGHDINTQEHGDAEDELLKLAGYDNEHSGNGKNLNPSISIKELKAKLISLNQSNEILTNEIKSLKKNMNSKDQEITFLKSMIKEDLSYIRHKLNEPKSNSTSGNTPTTTSTTKE